jgi:hypothetical protein
MAVGKHMIRYWFEFQQDDIFLPSAEVGYHCWHH